MKQNKHKKLTPHKCNNNFENSRKTTIKIFLFSHHPPCHQPSKLLLQATPNCCGIWHNGNFITTTFRSHITQFLYFMSPQKLKTLISFLSQNIAKVFFPPFHVPYLSFWAPFQKPSPWRGDISITCKSRKTHPPTLKHKWTTNPR